jgi:hypothetical protein
MPNVFNGIPRRYDVTRANILTSFRAEPRKFGAMSRMEAWFTNHVNSRVKSENGPKNSSENNNQEVKASP